MERARETLPHKTSKELEKRLMETKEGKKHFVLVHGACHGAWCWYKLATLLKSAGHTVTALDLAAAGTDPKQLKDVPSFSDYLEPLMKFFMDYKSLPTIEGGSGTIEQPSEEKVILVGHSLGGLAISKAMETFPEKISVAVFVTAIMPDPELDFPSFLKEGSRGDSSYTYDNGPENPPTAFNFGPKYNASHLYQLCPPEVLTLATMLLRPLRFHSKEDMAKQFVVSQEKYGSVRRVYVICGQDKAIPVEDQRKMIQNDSMIEVKEISGADHMPMLSKPEELFACLQEIVKT